jgi:thioester reductase-like protein
VPRTILFTGFPGFIGARLIPKLLASDPEATVVALVEPRMESRARELAREVGGERVRIEPGDITKESLGLSAETWEKLTAETVEVFHLAAIYDLAVPFELARRVNVTGTERVLDFCRACQRLERHLYVSTAYVAGLRHGVVLESELVAGQEFKNFYESTKYEAEVAVRASMEEHGVPTTIVRPAIVVGDSRTGETSKFDGPYYMLRTINATRGPLFGLGNPDAPFNVVPVDFVVDAIASAARDEATLGQTLHLVDPEPISSAEVFRALAREWDGRRPLFRAPPKLLDRALGFKRVRDFYGGTPRESLRYLNHAVRFDVTNASAALGRQGLRCPRFEEYVGPMVSFFRAHHTDPAFGAAK